MADAEGSTIPIVWTAPAVVTFDDAGGLPGSVGLAEAELTAAVAVWSSVGCADPVLVYEAAPVGEAGVTVTMVTDWVGMGFDADAAGTTDLVLQTSSDGGTEIVGAYVYLNGTFTWGSHPQAGTDGVRDLRAVLVHELGHVLGLEHSCEAGVAEIECTSAHAVTTMYPIYVGPEQALLDADDIEGICALYPPAPPPAPMVCESTRDCMEGERCRAETCRADGRYGLPCMVASDCTTHLCVAVDGVDGVAVDDTTSPGVCTHVCESNMDCPSGSACRPSDRDGLSVCAPLGTSAGCSVSPARGGRPFAALVWLAAGLAFVRGASRRRR